MFSTIDLLYLVLSVAVLWVAIFLCGALWQVGGFFKRANRMIDATTRQVEKVQDALMTLRDGMDRAMTYAGLFAKGGEMVIGALGKKKKGKGKKSDDDDEE